jgi:hypothetical protein
VEATNLYSASFNSTSAALPLMIDSDVNYHNLQTFKVQKQVKGQAKQDFIIHFGMRVL